MKSSFTTQLERQIGFLKRSCDAFDEGHKDEALRLAVSLRVLFHDTKISKSLLSHLKSKERVRILSTFDRAYAEDQETGMTYVSIPMLVTMDGSRNAPLDDTKRKDLIAVNEWWNEGITCMNQLISRKDIVLSATNQDGGAHVDAKPNKKTRELILGIGTLTNFVDGVSTTHTLDNQHFVLLRQLAYEVLNSPDIHRLCKKQCNQS